MLRCPGPRPRHLAPLRSSSLRSSAKCAPPQAQQSKIKVALGGASLSDEQREEMTNREGVASGSAT